MTHAPQCTGSACAGHGAAFLSGLQPDRVLGAPVVELSGVSFAYDGQEALTDVHLNVVVGDFLAVIGPNGGGKTTLIKLILGLLTPKSGSVRVLGADPALVRPAVGYVPQHAAVQPSFPITVRDVVLLGLERKARIWSGWTARGRAARQQALETLALVGMADLAMRRFDALSGGQKQRVLVARALMAEPALLLFDEPTANIDPQGKLCLFELLSDLSAAITVVMVSHDLIFASTRITSVAAVNQHLIQSRGQGLTPDMLRLIYGDHDPSCPLGTYIQGVSAVFGAVQA